MNLAHAPAQGLDEYGHHYAGGQFLPFYVPRLCMPQIDAVHLPELLARAFEEGLTPEITVCPPETLHAHQRVSHDKARAISPEIRRFPVLVSADGYVLDGNHRWWSCYHAQEPITVIRLNLGFEAALTWLFGQPYTYTAPALDCRA